MPDWGGLLQSAVDGVKSAAQTVSTGAAAAKQAISDKAAAAYQGAVALGDAAVNKVKAGYNTAVELGTEAAEDVKAGAVATYDGATNLAKHAAASAVLNAEDGIASRLSSGGKGLSSAAALASKAYKKVKETFDPAQPVTVPCVSCLGADSAGARAKRIQKRNSLIADGEDSDDPDVRAQAAQLKDDMVAVELARLSDNTYDQSYDHPRGEAKSPPPEPWHALSDPELKAAGIDPDLLRKSKAVVYQIPPDSNFPFDPKTVLAFRGTTSDPGDILADHDQALGLKNDQYTAAMALGKKVATAFPDTEVTGHSLGGGKAQAAGVAGDLQGIMFNSAGLNPKTLNMTPDDLNSFSDNFLQYRADGGLTKGYGDPLTGVQNSLGAQKAVYGLAQAAQGLGRVDAWARKVEGVPSWTENLPADQRGLARDLSDRILNVTPQEAANNFKLSGGKWYIPPALGEIRDVTSKNADGTDTSLADQHNMTHLVNGLETRKYDNVSSLLDATGNDDDPAAYMGKTTVEMR